MLNKSLQGHLSGEHPCIKNSQEREFLSSIPTFPSPQERTQKKKTMLNNNRINFELVDIQFEQTDLYPRNQV